MDLVVNDAYLLGNIFSFLSVRELRFAFCVSRLWNRETRYILNKQIITPWMKHQFLFQQHFQIKTFDLTEINQIICFDSERGIVVYHLSKQKKEISVIYFQSVYNSNHCFRYELEQSVKLSRIGNDVSKIPAEFTKENRDRYFLFVYRAKGNLEFIEFTDSNIVIHYAKDGIAFDKNTRGWNQFWFKGMVTVFDLKPLMSLQSIYTDPITHIHYSGPLKEVRVQKDEDHPIKVYDFSNHIDNSKWNNRFWVFHRFLCIVYDYKLECYDLWSDDPFESKHEFIFSKLQYKKTQGPMTNYYFYSASYFEKQLNYPYMLYVSRSKDDVYLLNLENKTCELIPEINVQHSNRVTQKVNQYLFEHFEYTNFKVIQYLVSI